MHGEQRAAETGGMEEQREDPAMLAARRWFVLLREPDALGAAEQAAFAAWLAADPAHRAAWQQVQALWQRYDAALPALRQQAALAAAARQARPSRRDWLKRAAGLAIVAGAGGYLLGAQDWLADHRTAIGETRHITLPDGSTLELGGGSALSLAFSPGQRLVRLHRGEAFFDVAPDPARPFLVQAAEGRLHALGTRFNVKRNDDAVTLTVAEHLVAVALPGAAARTLGAGQQLRYAGHAFGPLRQVDAGAIQAWRQGRLFFQDTPLSDVLADLDRYRRGRIIITDGKLAALPVTGFFHAAQADEALRSIAKILQLRLTRLTNLLVLVQAA